MPICRDSPSRPRVGGVPALGQHQAVAAAEIEDKWMSQVFEETENLERDASLESLHRSCFSALKSLRLPTARNEDYRFTDLSVLSRSPVYAPTNPVSETISSIVFSAELDGPAIKMVVVNGVVAEVILPEEVVVDEGVYIGNAKHAPKDVLSYSLGNQSRTRGGPFAVLNGASVRDCAVVYVPERCSVDVPIQIINISSGSSTPGKQAYSAPRMLIFLEAGAKAEIVEEYFTVEEANAGSSACCSVTEIELDDGASLSHKLVIADESRAINLKSTLVSQGTESEYSLVEVRSGGLLTRHDVGVVQLGKATHTAMKHFVLAADDQLHDVHTKLTLDHPEGKADQLHKCIAASATAKGVFDGNVRVNRMAQQTDAQQLSRNLLLAPKATVNVKPNLQIVADDVKCTHGCAVSDLEEEQLFYLQARGIDTATARKMLVYSFGGEVVQSLTDKKLMARVEAEVNKSLDRMFAYS